MDLTNKVIAVTGGAQGLGFAMAKGIAERGARLALIDMNAEPLEQAAASLRELGGEVATFVANVADEDSVIAAFDGIIDQFGSRQCLINNAGITPRSLRCGLNRHRRRLLAMSRFAPGSDQPGERYQRHT